MGDNTNLNLPPGFRFHPTDEELLHFLHRKSSLLSSHSDVIPDLDLYPYDPWQLNGKALAEGNQWYFYSRRIQNRTTENGYWKAMGFEEPINSSATNKKLGMKKYFMFHLGPDGISTNWFMQEYRLLDNSGSSSRSSSSKRRGHSKILDQGKWVLCRVYERNYEDDDNGTELSCLDEVFLSLDDLDEISLPNN